jgi:signal transduction histidine kinase/CheY-like chemotaxis protein
VNGDSALLLLSLALAFLLGILISRVVSARTRESSEADEIRSLHQRADRARIDLIANVSHELRTPLNAIMGVSDLLRDTALSEEQRKLVKTLQRSADGLLAQLNDLLDFAKLDNGRLQLEAIEFSLREVVEDVVALFEPSAHAKHLVLLLHVEEGASVTAVGDPLRLRQVVSNLVGNAIKFADRGRVAVTLSTSADAEARARITVSDEGPGIDPADRERLFQPFQQRDSSTARRFGGTGLGLAISRELMRLMGGRVFLQDRPGKGATFVIELPLRRLTERGAAHVTAPTPLRPPSLRPSAASAGPRAAETPRRALDVLVVDDNQVNREVFGALLSALGHLPRHAESGEAALAALSQAWPEVLLLDVQMPGMDGFEVARLVRERAQGRAVHIIAATANALPSDRERCLMAGMDDYLAKPVRRAELAAVLSRVSVPSATPEAQAAAAVPPASPPANGAEPRLSSAFDDLSASLPAQALHKAVSTFLRESPLRLAELRRAIADGDPGAARFLSHSLKGSSAMLGGEDARAAFERLEALAKAGDLSGLKDALSDAEQAFSGLCTLLERRVTKAPATGTASNA